jgi:hypothetical protein
MTNFPRARTDYTALGFQLDGDLPANFPDDWVNANATQGNAIGAGTPVNGIIIALNGTEQDNVMTFNPPDSSHPVRLQRVTYEGRAKSARYRAVSQI